MKKTLSGLVALIAVILTGCSQYSLVNSYSYNTADLTECHTFRIVTPDEGQLPPGMTMVTYYNIAAAIREQMVDRGYTEDPASPLLVNLALTVNKELATAPLYTQLPPPPAIGPVPMGPNPWAPGPFYNGVGPFYMYPPTYVNPNAQVITGMYREGVLTMDIVNTSLKQAVYTASVATILDNGDSQFLALQGIAKAVDVLFSKFPVPMLPQYK